MQGKMKKDEMCCNNSVILKSWTLIQDRNEEFLS